MVGDWQNSIFKDPAHEIALGLHGRGTVTQNVASEVREETVCDNDQAPKNGKLIIGKAVDLVLMRGSNANDLARVLTLRNGLFDDV